MKGIAFTAIAALIGYIASNYLPVPPGMDLPVNLSGTVGAIAGGALGILYSKTKQRRVALLILLALVVFVVGLVMFNQTSEGEPSRIASYLLYVWTLLIFTPVGFLIQLAGLKISPDEDE